MPEIKRLTSYEEFESWKQSVSDRIAFLFACIPQAIQNQLNYSFESLSVLEMWLLNKYPEFESALDETEYPLIDAAGTYVGETFRRSFGGEWVIELADKQNAYLGIPGITGFKGIQIPPVVYPRTWITTSIHRRDGNFLYSRFEKIARSV